MIIDKIWKLTNVVRVGLARLLGPHTHRDKPLSRIMCVPNPPLSRCVTLWKFDSFLFFLKLEKPQETWGCSCHGQTWWAYEYGRGWKRQRPGLIKQSYLGWCGWEICEWETGATTYSLTDAHIHIHTFPCATYTNTLEVLLHFQHLIPCPSLPTINHVNKRSLLITSCW